MTCGPSAGSVATAPWNCPKRSVVPVPVPVRLGSPLSASGFWGDIRSRGVAKPCLGSAVSVCCRGSVLSPIGSRGSFRFIGSKALICRSRSSYGVSLGCTGKFRSARLLLSMAGSSPAGVVVGPGVVGPGVEGAGFCPGGTGCVTSWLRIWRVVSDANNRSLAGPRTAAPASRTFDLTLQCLPMRAPMSSGPRTVPPDTAQLRTARHKVDCGGPLMGVTGRPEGGIGPVRHATSVAEGCRTFRARAVFGITVIRWPKPKC